MKQKPVSDQQNLLIAIVLSIAILVGFQFFFAKPQPAVQTQAAGADATAPTPTAAQVSQATGQSVAGHGTSTPMTTPVVAKDRAEVIAQSDRIQIDNDEIHGSLRLKGGRIDDLTFKHYRAEADPESDEVVLLSPAGSYAPYYAEFGWVAAAGADVKIPDASTVWTASHKKLSPAQPVTLSWDNGQGVVFERTISLDENYMFTVTQNVRNNSGSDVTLFPYSLISRSGEEQGEKRWILHEGPIGVAGSELQEIDYKDLRKKGPQKFDTGGGWFGITDKYWLTALIPTQEGTVTGRYSHVNGGGIDRYQVDALSPGITVAAGEQASATNRFFAGAKRVRLLDHYSEELNVEHLDLAIDFGWYYFITKPFFYALDWLSGQFGNFGIGILLLTVLIKILFFPLANKSYVTMSKMKKLQPKIKELQETYKDDRQKISEELMKLYTEEKVNPLSGCLPILIQIPVFFALYKVLFITLEMRHAPFYGWINDLSAPDPTSVFNLFGLLPFDPPSFMMIGVWPLLMGISMWFQQKMNPKPTDPTQAMVIGLMPIFFTFLLAGFPAGLVIYWTWNNTLSIIQQWVIMRRMGVSID